MKVEFKAVKECRAIIRGFIRCEEDNDMSRRGSDRHRYDMINRVVRFLCQE